MTLSWERTRRNRTHSTESTHTTKSSTPGNHRTPGGTQCTDREIYCHFGSSGSVIFHTWPSSRLAFNPSPQWPLRPERLMKKTRRHILSRNIIWETMDSQVLTAGWTRALGHDRTWQEKRRAWQGSQNLIFTIRGQSFFPRFPELFSNGIWSALEYGEVEDFARTVSNTRVFPCLWDIGLREQWFYQPWP